MKFKEFEDWMTNDLGFGWAIGEGCYGADYDVEVNKNNLFWGYIVKDAAIDFLTWLADNADVIRDADGDFTHRYTTTDGISIDIAFV